MRPILWLGVTSVDRFICSLRVQLSITAVAFFTLNGCRSETRSLSDATHQLIREESAQPTLPPSIESMSGQQMYAALCVACHGTEGDGTGPGARSVWPPPRNFRRDKFRLVSAENRVPSSADIERVIHRGMPGTSMASFEALNDQQRKMIAKEVLRLRHEGLRDRTIHEMQLEGVPIVEEEIEATIRRATLPSETVAVPDIASSDPQGIERGRHIYCQQRCDSCHGQDGMGAWDVYLRDDGGNPTRPRDLAHEPFKGGHEPEAIYLRLRLGMPGTPHPSSPSLSEQESINLVHYCRSLSREPKLQLTGHQRRMWATSKSYLRSQGKAEPY